MSRTARNVLYNLLGQGILLVISLASARLLVGHLSKDVYGLISFALLLNATIAGVIISGIGFSIIRDVSQNLESDRAYVEQLLQTSSLIYWGCALAAGAFLWLGAPWIAGHWLHLNSLSVETATHLLRILGISALLAIPTALYNAVLRGMERMKLTNLIDVSRTFVTQAGLITLLVNNANAYTVATWIVFVNALGTLAYLFTLVRQFRLTTFVPVPHISVLRRNLQLVFNFSLMSVTGVVHRQADKLIVSALLPVANLGYYNFAYQLIERATFMRAAVTSALYPALSRLAAAQAGEQLQQQYRKWFDLMTIGLGPIFAAALFLTVPLFSYVFDAGVAHRMIVPMALLTLGTYMNATLTVPHVTSMAVGRPDITARLNLYAVLIMLPLTYFLIWRFGLIGAAVTWPLYHAVMYVLFVPKFCQECLPMSIAGWYGHTARILLTTLLTYGLAYWILLTNGKANDLALLTLIYLAASAFFVGIATWFMSEELRMALRNALNRLLPLQQVLTFTERLVHRQLR